MTKGLSQVLSAGTRDMGPNGFDHTHRAHGMEGVDFGNAVSDYSTYGAGFPSSFFAELEQRGVPIRGMHAVDLWTGTGNVACEFVIPGASTVIGIDAAESNTRGHESLMRPPRLRRVSQHNSRSNRAAVDGDGDTDLTLTTSNGSIYIE